MEKTLLDYLYSNKEFAFCVADDIYFPRFIVDCKTGRKHNIEKLRYFLLNSRRKGELSFVKFCKEEREKYKKCQYNNVIEQYPIAINNRPLWKNLCKKHGCLGKADRNGKEYQDKNLFFIDAYIPGPMIALEVDYPYTHTCTEYDRARDDYVLAAYNIKTERFSEYGIDALKSIRAENRVRDIFCAIRNEDYDPVPINYTGRNNSVGLFREKWCEEYKVLRKLKNNIIPISKLLKLTRGNYEMIDRVCWLSELEGKNITVIPKA